LHKDKFGTAAGREQNVQGGEQNSFYKLSWLSIVAAATSFGYAFIGIGLSVATGTRG
jgi:hypothetical protein